MHLLLLILALAQSDKPPATGVDAVIASALRNHPDVRVAEANRLLAEAELEQTKLAVTKRVSAAYAKVDAAKIKYEARAKNQKLVEMYHSAGANQQLLQSTADFADAKAEIALADEDLKAAVGSAKTPSTAAEGVAVALKQHPDIKVAEAKVAVAAAELDQARLTVTQRVGPAFARIQTAKVKVAAAEDDLNRVAGMVKKGIVSKAEADRADAAVLASKAELATAEAELKAVTGGGEPADAESARSKYARLRLAQLKDVHPETTSAPAGTVADKLRAVIDKKVKFPEQKGVPFVKVVDALKAAAGIDFTVRLPNHAQFTEQGVNVPAGEMTVSAWTELMLDEFNVGRIKYAFYIREYGLLLAAVDAAPPGALSLTEFARLVRAEKEEKKAEPKR